MAESNAPSLRDQYQSALKSLNSTAHEVTYIANFFLLHSQKLSELVGLWYESMRNDKPMRSPLLFTANEIILHTCDQDISKACWGYVEAFGNLLEEICHLLGRDDDRPALGDFLNILLIWERLPCRVFAKDYMRMIIALTEVGGRQEYLQQRGDGVLYRKVEHFEITRKLKEVADLQEEFAVKRALCGEKAVKWLFFSSQSLCLRLVEALAAIVMMLSRLLVSEYAVWKAASDSSRS